MDYACIVLFEAVLVIMLCLFSMHTIKAYLDIHDLYAAYMQFVCFNFSVLLLLDIGFFKYM